MSDGGLLQKAIEQQSAGQEESVLVADVGSSDSKSFFSGPIGIGAGLAALALIVSFIVSRPSIQSDYAFLGLVPILIFGISFYLIWNAVGKKQTAAIAVVYLLLAASPYLVMSLSSGEITVTDSELSDDSSTITLTIRESGAIMGSSVDSAVVSITYDGTEIYSESMAFSINREDGYGKYGEITLTVADWYQGNAADNAEYVVSVDTGESSDSMLLQSRHLQRTVEDAKGETSGAMGYGNDCESSKDSCIIGVALKSWSGLDALGDNPPGPMPYADYTVQAKMYYGSSVVISYPLVTVVNGVAEWDSGNGEFGGGSALVAEDGSELPLPGSVESFELNTKYVPIDDWAVSDYGCYHFTVETTQNSPWSDGSTITHTSYYEFTEEGDGGTGDDPGEPTSESWTKVSSC
ncbi:MAG: hypothetical protein VX493_00710 [Candidatus Thermoplasmatota archaeon]|nr:hypothetical protein [Candidatus Thermoplasmatota archaeon]